MPLKPGDRIERYLIDGLLGSGGMGEVYRAQDPRLKRAIALKILRADPGTEGTMPASASASSPVSDAGARMVREAQLAAALDHPNVVAIFDVGQIEQPEELRGTTYLAMELIRGESLRKYIGDASVRMKVRVRWLEEIARALAAAHAAGLVHRDVKPENVMIREDGIVKVLDFGVAKRTIAAPVDATSSTEGFAIPTRTAQGVVVGTPMYMAPEQLRAEPLDGRADQFSWGVVAYELLAGKGLWSVEGGGFSLVAQILQAPPPSLTALPGVPPRVAGVVARALAKDPEARFPNMTALLEELTGKVGTDDTEPKIPVRLSSPELEEEKKRFSEAPTEHVRAAGTSAPQLPSASTRRSAVSEARQVAATPGPPPPARAARRGRMLAWMAAAALATAIAGIVAVRRGGAPVSSAPPAPAIADARAAAPPCTTHADCAKGLQKPSVCRAGDHVCVPIESDDCRVVTSSPADASNEGTLWIGAMLPLHDPSFLELGELDALELARDEISSITRGVPAPDGLGVARPIGLVECDDGSNPTRAARHLADDLHVPAVIGFATSAEALDVIPSTLLPARVVSLAVRNGSPLIAKIPQPPDARYSWRPSIAMTLGARGTARLIPQVLEPLVRGREPTRVALIEQDTVGGRSVTDAIVEGLRFNDKSASANGHDFEEVLFRLDDKSSDEALLARLFALSPQIVILGDTGEAVISRFVRPLEGHGKGAIRPYYVVPDVVDATDLAPLFDQDPDLRRRVFGMYGPLDTPTNREFTMHYNEHAKQEATLASSPSSVYDALYLVVYAAYVAAVRGEGASGPAIARAIPALSRGEHIGVGRSHVLEAFALIRRDQGIRLDGAATTLAFDTATGDVVEDLVVHCLVPIPRSTSFEAKELPVRFDSAKGTWSGGLRCP